MRNYVLFLEIVRFYDYVIRVISGVIVAQR